jgi:hypothetical protein
VEAADAAVHRRRHCLLYASDSVCILRNCSRPFVQRAGAVSLFTVLFPVQLYNIQKNLSNYCSPCEFVL